MADRGLVQRRSKQQPEHLVAEEDQPMAEMAQETPSFHWGEVVWYNVIMLALWHIGALYTMLFVLPSATLEQVVVLWGVFWFYSGLGITAGAHRLWSHRSYRAKLPLRVFLMLANSMAFQGSIFEWARDHRVHHKGSDTTADPHNSGRGFFFAHMGWVMVRKHENVRLQGQKISVADLLEESVIAFQKRHYFKTVLLMCYVMPTAVGWATGDSWTGFWLGGVFRHVWVLHMTWFINSLAHFYGYRPYDANARATENLIASIGAIGEGYHNYHHKFPADYAASEWGIMTGQWNPTKLFIDVCATVGLASDLKRSRTAAATRERVAAKQLQAKPKSYRSTTVDKVLTRAFFGRSEEHMF